MYNIFIGKEQITVNEELYTYLVGTLINFPFINDIEFVLDDIFINPNMDESKLITILRVIYYAIKMYGDYLFSSKNASLCNLWHENGINNEGIYNSNIIKESYKLIIKIDEEIDSLNTLMGYDR